MKEILLSAKDVTKTFGGEGQTNVLDHVTTDIYKGDFTVIMGPSGAGKSTLLYALSGMDDISDGCVLYGERDLGRLKEKDMARLRAEDFGFVFQQTHLVSNFTLLENVLAAGYLNRNRSKAEVLKLAIMLLERMRVGDAMKRFPAKVSGGEAQRAALARALINEPSILFADEPTGALNRKNSEEVLDLMTEIHGEGQSILMVTHDVRAAIRGTRILYLEDGKIKGETKLSSYREEDAKGREHTVNQWLMEMEW